MNDQRYAYKRQVAAALDRQLHVDADVLSMDCIDALVKSGVSIAVINKVSAKVRAMLATFVANATV